MKLKLESVGYIIELMTERIRDKKYIVLVNADGTLQPYNFCDDDGEIDYDIVNEFLAEVKENAEDMIASGVIVDPEEAVALTLASFSGSATYNKLDDSDPSALSYIR